MKKVFDAKGDFNAMSEAEKWLKSQGYSIGSMARDLPIGIKKGTWNIAKWYNLSDTDKSILNGQIEGEMREGPVTVSIYG